MAKENLSAIAEEAKATLGAPDPAAPAAGPAQLDEASAVEAFKREASEWAMVPWTFGSILQMAMPELAAVYSDENCQTWGERMVPLARKYNWQFGTAMLWIALLGQSWTMLGPTLKAIKAKRAAARAASAEATAKPDKPAA